MGTSITDAERSHAKPGWSYHLDNPLGRYSRRFLNTQALQPVRREKAISLGVCYHASSCQLWLLMIAVGLADCAMLITVLTLPIELVPKEEVGAASGLVLSIGHIGGVIGPLIGGRILDLTGSLDLSLIMLIGVTVAAAFIALRLPETGPKARSQPQ